MSESFPESTGNGKGADSLKTTTVSPIISISPVGIFVFSFPAGLARTSPVIIRHHSARSDPAIFSSRITTCTEPDASRRSIKATPP